MGTNVLDIRIGNKLPLANIPAGSIISSVGKNKAIYARSAGTSCQLLQKGAVISKIRIPSGEIKYVKSNIFATIGMISNDTQDRKSTRLNSSHVRISYAVFCLKKKKKKN